MLNQCFHSDLRNRELCIRINATSLAIYELFQQSLGRFICVTNHCSCPANAIEPPLPMPATPLLARYVSIPVITNVFSVSATIAASSRRSTGQFSVFGKFNNQNVMAATMF